jgi:hypothetical protein
LYPYYENKETEVLGYVEGYLNLLEELIQKNRIRWIYLLIVDFVRELETYLDGIKDEYKK